MKELLKQTKYLKFYKLPRLKNKKTDIISIESISSGILLGHIQWYGQWRQYCFFPSNSTLWNSGCMEDVYEIIIDLKKERINTNSV